MILALDIATQLGWAYGAPGEVPSSGTVKLGDKDSSPEARGYRAKLWIYDRFERGPLPKIIAIEGQLHPQAFSDKRAAKLLYGLPMVMGVAAWDFDVRDIREHEVADVRGLFIGYRRLKSELAKAEVQKKCRALGWPAVDHNAADALALWAYQATKVAPKVMLQQLGRVRRYG
jgi:hypothetical protein